MRTVNETMGERNETVIEAADSGPPALLVLEDGTTFAGRGVGHPGEAFGEVVFNTSMTGYQEVLTDPSYRGQIVVMTYPEIGIYGVNDDDDESDDIQVAGFVVHHAVAAPSSHRATGSLVGHLADREVPAIEGIDTRALARHLRSCGAMRGAISSLESDPQCLLGRVLDHPSLVGRDLAREAASGQIEPGASSPDATVRIVLVDGGAKAGISRSLLEHAAHRERSAPIDVIRVGYDTPLEEVLAWTPCGVIVSNGPGDPAPLVSTIDLVRSLLERRIPVAGICLGHQILGLALGATTYKMRFGHRGSNHPVLHHASGRVMVTSQNHGFAIDPTSLGVAWAPLDAAFVATRAELVDSAAAAGAAATGTMAERLPDEPLVGASPLGFGAIEITHLSLNDGTLEGLRLVDRPALSVQFHPEASPGPHDAAGFFDEFLADVEAHHAQA